MEAPVPGTSKNSSPESPGVGAPRVRLSRARKRRRISSETSSDTEPVLPANTLEVEKNLHASAIKNNLDDVSVKKILKKVVTNDHVLALVKLREEEENMAMMDDGIEPKLTRSKVKELMKVSPKTAWKLENMALTPIKHIPVKTRPEVTALIDQELPEDEDDDEYEPTNDDVPSDEDHTLESCSDLDSQPRTPATPASPRVLKDGPFKIPQNVTPRRIDTDEDATIALRTRSKLSLSSIPIDHIESSFVPPDEVPMPAADDVWTEFLQVCLNPETEKDADDEDDPEYNVHADPDANDEDEEGLENIIKISKKELNDLVTELFNVMPEGLGDEMLTGKLASGVPPQNTEQIASTWEGKQEPLSDDETPPTANAIQSQERRLSIGKTEPLSDTECQDSEKENLQNNQTPPAQPRRPTNVTVAVVDSSVNVYPATNGGTKVPPALVQGLLQTQNVVTIQIEQGAKILPEQIEILQQQLRQHIQLAASNFLQLFVHPLHWGVAPTYKEYIETLNNITTDNPKSVVHVCNLKPAWELITSWEKSVSEATPENNKMIEFIQKQIERSRRRAAQNSLYVGDFHPTFLNVVANSPVFLYPQLLPPLPYRVDSHKRFSYMRCEDELIALGIDEFWQYVENNPELYKPKIMSSGHRWGLVTTVDLLCKHMFPWLPPKTLLGHISHVRKHKSKDADNPINKFFATREVTPVKHVLLPFNPNMTLYEQPEYEMPKIWVKYLSKNSRRFRDYRYRRTKVTSLPGVGVPVDLGVAVQAPTKKPLPINFTQKMPSSRLNVLPVQPPEETQDKYDVKVVPPANTSPSLVFGVVQTSAGSYLIPISIQTNTVASAKTPICSAEVKETVASNLPESSNVPTVSVTVPIRNYVPKVDYVDLTDCDEVTNSEKTPVASEQVSNSDLVKSNSEVPASGKAPNSKMLVITPLVNHCECCVLLRKKIKLRQSLITDFFLSPKETTCPCKEKRTFIYPRVSKKLRLLVNNYKCKSYRTLQALVSRSKALKKELMYGVESSEDEDYTLDEIAEVVSFQLKLTVRASVARDNWMKRKINNLLSKFDPDADNPCTLMDQMEKVLNVECVDVYKEFLGFLTMEQADHMGKFLDYFLQECLESLMKKVEELVPNKHHKELILTRIRNILTKDQGLCHVTCDLCVRIIEACSRYPALTEYVFSLFPHRRDHKVKQEAHIQVLNPADESQEKTTVEALQTTDNIETVTAETLDTDITESEMSDPLATDSVRKNESVNLVTTDNTETEAAETLDTDITESEMSDPLATDNVRINQPVNPVTTDNNETVAAKTHDTDITENEMSDPLATDNVRNETAIPPATDVADERADPEVIENEFEYNDSQVMDYEADQSDSDGEGSIDHLTIIEDPEESGDTRESNNTNDEPALRNVIDTPNLTVTKTEVQDNSDSDMSMMIMSEDEIKTEPTEWKRDEDKLLLEVLQQSLTPEEIMDKTILEIVEQKKVLRLAADKLHEKTLDDVRERILYLLKFLVLNEQRL